MPLLGGVETQIQGDHPCSPHVPSALSAAVLAALLAAGTIGAAPAIAGRPLPKPTGLAASVDAHPGGTYDVSASWDVSAGATSYRVTLTKGGTTLASKTVTTNAWSPTVTRYARHRHPERARRRRSQAREARHARGPARRRHRADGHLHL